MINFSVYLFINKVHAKFGCKGTKKKWNMQEKNAKLERKKIFWENFECFGANLAYFFPLFCYFSSIIYVVYNTNALTCKN